MHLPILLVFTLNMLVVQSHRRTAFRPPYRPSVPDRKQSPILFVGIFLRLHDITEEFDNDYDDDSPSLRCVCVRNNECHPDDTHNEWGCDVTNYVCCRNPMQQKMDPTTPHHTSPTENQTHRPTPINSSEMIHQMQVGSSAIQGSTMTSTTSFTHTPSSSNSVCTCTPFFRCYDEETSSNLTNIVNDRSTFKVSCPSPIDKCCLNLNPPPSSLSIKPQSLSRDETSPSSDNDCVCTPFFRCYDNETSSNLTDIVDDRINIPLCQDSKALKICPKPDDVCCCNLEKPSEQPKQLRPSTTTPSECEGNCTPASDCPGEDISSTISKQGICIDSDHICCHELVLPESNIPSVKTFQNSTLSPSSQSKPDCLGSCVPIIECPDLSNTLEEAGRGLLYAIIKLRNAVCSNENGRLSVCCPNNRS